MKHALWPSLVSIGLLASTGVRPAASQATLEELWPNSDGLRWSYGLDWTYVIPDIAATGFDTGTGTLTLNGTVPVPGGTAQILEEQMTLLAPTLAGAPVLDGLERFLWVARPDLQPTLRIEAATRSKRGAWYSLMIHGGYFDEESTSIDMWQEGLPNKTWRYLEDDLGLGAQFTFQLIPDLADDVFLHATVGALDEAVSTPAGDFVGVRMDYEIDSGIGTLTNEDGEPIGAVHGEVMGQVIFVPSVGPVFSNERHTPIMWADCSPNPCPPEITDFVGVVMDDMTLSLSVMPVAASSRSWSAVKASFER